MRTKRKNSSEEVENAKTKLDKLALKNCESCTRWWTLNWNFPNQGPMEIYARLRIFKDGDGQLLALVSSHTWEGPDQVKGADLPIVICETAIPIVGIEITKEQIAAQRHFKLTEEIISQMTDKLWESIQKIESEK